jgi:hypothetical protein
MDLSRHYPPVTQCLKLVTERNPISGLAYRPADYALPAHRLLESLTGRRSAIPVCPGLNGGVSGGVSLG